MRAIAVSNARAADQSTPKMDAITSVNPTATDIRRERKAAVEAYLYSLKMRAVEVAATFAKCAESPTAVLDRLDAVEKLPDLARLGLCASYLGDKDVIARFSRIRSGHDQRARIRSYMRHVGWALTYGIPRRALKGLSTLEWEIAEQGNPWIIMPVVLECDSLPPPNVTNNFTADNLTRICMEFAGDHMTQEQLDDESVQRVFQTAAAYHWTLAFLERNAEQDRVPIRELWEALAKTHMGATLPYCEKDVAEFDPSLGLIQRHDLFEVDMSPDLLETFAQASRRFSKVQRELRDELLEEGGDATQVQAKPKKLKMFEWRAFQRMQNRVAFTAHPATEYFEATKVGEFDYVVLRKAYLAEKALPRLLDAIRDQTLWRREAEAARDAMRRTRTPTRKRKREHAPTQESSSDDDDDDSEDEEHEGDAPPPQPRAPRRKSWKSGAAGLSLSDDDDEDDDDDDE